MTLTIEGYSSFIYTFSLLRGSNESGLILRCAVLNMTLLNKLFRGLCPAVRFESCVCPDCLAQWAPAHFTASSCFPKRGEHKSSKPPAAVAL